MDVGAHTAVGVDGDAEALLSTGVLLSCLNPGAIGVSAQVEAGNPRCWTAQIEEHLDVLVQIRLLCGVDGANEFPLIAGVVVAEVSIAPAPSRDMAESTRMGTLPPAFTRFGGARTP